MGTPANLLVSSQQCQGVPFPQICQNYDKIIYSCRGPISADLICPQPRRAGAAPRPREGPRGDPRGARAEVLLLIIHIVIRLINTHTHENDTTTTTTTTNDDNNDDNNDNHNNDEGRERPERPGREGRARAGRPDKHNR